MGVVICYRCGEWIDLDWDSDVLTNEDIPGLTKEHGEFVHFKCLTDEEAEKLEE